MRQRARLVLRPRVLPPCRHFTVQAALRSRPRLPFLAIPVTGPQRVRLFTTETKQWLKHEIYGAARYTAVFGGMALCLAGIYLLVREELLDRELPTPREYSFWSRQALRAALDARREKGEVNWVLVMESALRVIRRLEDPTKDGARLKNPAKIPDSDAVAYDITAKTENWRRGYYQALMLAATAAEQTDGWVLDRSRKLVFPPEVVIGDSNKHPKPIPAWATNSAPREENCESAYESAEYYYAKICQTEGFTARQKMDAALAWASFADFKQKHDLADDLFHQAFLLAYQKPKAPFQPISTEAHNLRNTRGTGPPSANALAAFTAWVTHHAQHGDSTLALSLYLSLLSARRSLPNTPPAKRAPREEPDFGVIWKLAALLQEPPYPPPPDDGTSPPWRDSKELCEEASLQLNIGEILYINQRREDGLAWTRDGVDLAEEQLRKLAGIGAEDNREAAQKTCRECLRSGLENWTKMVGRLAGEEERKKEGAKTATFGFWSLGGDAAATDRWAAERNVVQERVRRTQELLDEATPEATGWLALLKA